MIMRITWGKLHPGKWDDFEQAYKSTVATQGKNIKGLRGRWLIRDTDDADAGFSVSLWDNEADMRTYEQSPLYQQLVTPLQPFFIGEFKTYHGEVKYQDS